MTPRLVPHAPRSSGSRLTAHGYRLPATGYRLTSHVSRLFTFTIFGMATAKGKLSEYTAKRAFDATPEPKGDVADRRSGPLLFVVQQHAARRTHYDFRLECDGVLLSWAVPRGP